MMIPDIINRKSLVPSSLPRTMSSVLLFYYSHYVIIVRKIMLLQNSSWRPVMRRLPLVAYPRVRFLQPLGTQFALVITRLNMWLPAIYSALRNRPGDASSNIAAERQFTPVVNPFLVFPLVHNVSVCLPLS